MGNTKSLRSPGEETPDSLRLIDRGLRVNRAKSAVAAGLVAGHVVGHVVLHAAQAAAKALGELMPRAPKAGLQGVFGDPELLCRLTGRVAVHLAKHESGAKQR